MEITTERNKRIKRLREQLPFLNSYQEEIQNEELKKLSNNIILLFKKADSEKKDINIPDQKIDLLIASVEKLKKYTEDVKAKGFQLQDLRGKRAQASKSKNESIVTPPNETSSAAESNSPQRRQQKELRRLQENIVKDESPLPSRRTIKRNSKYLSSNDTLETVDDHQSPASKRRSEVENSVEKRTLPVKMSRSMIDLPSQQTKEFTTSTPKPVGSIKLPLVRVLPSKRQSLEKPDEKVPPLKISTLTAKATKAAEKSTFEIKKVIPSKHTQEISPSLKCFFDNYPRRGLRKEIKQTVVAPSDVNNEEPMETEHTNSNNLDVEKNKHNRKEIENMGYVAVRKGFIFQCVAENCFFNTMKKFSFINHLEENHEDIKWSGYCKTCLNNVGQKHQESKEDEFWHMMEKHVHKESKSTENLPDIVDLPIAEKNEESSGITNEEQEAADFQSEVLLDEIPSQKIEIINSRFLRKKINKKRFSPLVDAKPDTTNAAPQRLKVKTFASMSNFSNKDENAKLFPMVHDTSPTKQKETKANIVIDTAQKTQAHDLKALMQKQTEENLRKLQSAAKNANIINNIPQREKEQLKLSEEVSTPVKFYIRKPTSACSQEQEAHVEDGKVESLNLRPWLTRPAKKYLNRTVKLLTLQALASTFKCMGAKCDFFTDDPKKFATHIKEHMSITPGDIASYIICPYCNFGDFKKNSTDDLIKHIQEEHGYDKYQCKYCFYRSCANFNVLSHQKIHHRIQPHCIIQLEFKNSFQRDYKKEIATVKQTCGKFLKPLTCATCKLLSGEIKKFYVLKHYLNHLKNHEKNKEIIKAQCKICNKLVDSAETLYSHIFECFDNFGLQQCVYCLFGTNQDDKMHEHISNCHPSKLSLICARTSNQPMKENASQDEYQSMSLKFLTKDVAEDYIISVDGITKSKASPISVSSGIQIKNVFSLSSSSMK